MGDLKPCPFCGAKRGDHAAPLQFNAESERALPWHVYCWSCRIEGPSRATEAEAVEAWNTRPEPASPALLAALTRALPYVETAEADEAYKPGEVAKVTAMIRAAIRQAEGGE